MKGWFPCMRKIKITADSSANLLDLNTIPFASAPLKVITAETEFVDDAHLDVSAMLVILTCLVIGILDLIFQTYKIKHGGLT